MNDPERDFTLEELRTLKIAVIRAMDSITDTDSKTEAQKYSNLYNEFDELYQKLRNLGA